MIKGRDLLLGLLLFWSVVSPARTLIVVHPQLIFDKQSLAGARTRELLDDPSFTRKIVLLTSVNAKDLTFETAGIEFQKVESMGGDFAWDDSDDDIVLAGGFLSGCMVNALLDIAKDSSRPLQVAIDLDGTYTWNCAASGYLSSEVRYKKKTLREFIAFYGSEALGQMDDSSLYDQIRGRHNWQKARWPEAAEVRDFVLDFKYRGEPIMRYGDGQRPIEVQFLEVASAGCETGLKR